MKKNLILILSIAAASLLWGAQEILTHDPTDYPGNNNPSGIPIANSQINGSNLVSTATGGTTADAGKVGLLGSNGVFNTSMLPIGLPSNVSSNLNGYTYTSGAGYTWSTIMSLTTTATNGTVHVTAQTLLAPSQPETVWLRVVDSANTVAGHDGRPAISGANCTPYCAVLDDVLTGTTKTYLMQVSTADTSTTFTNLYTGSAGTAVSFTNAFSFVIAQHPLKQ